MQLSKNKLTKVSHQNINEEFFKRRIQATKMRGLKVVGATRCIVLVCIKGESKIKFDI